MCAVLSYRQIYFSAEDRPLYSFQSAEPTTALKIHTVIEDVEVAGLAIYCSISSEYLFIAHDKVIDIYDQQFTQKATFGLSGLSNLSIEGGL